MSQNFPKTMLITIQKQKFGNSQWKYLVEHNTVQRIFDLHAG